ncbi:MAG: hypothetical protein GXP33_07315 [Spirochaetes bacterium]|nr:hypothetical protein [Spirochaetota bacterium]
MEKVVLITDVDTPLGYEIAGKYIASGIRLITASSSDEKIESFSSMGSERYLQVKWSRRSPISARNVILAGLNHFKRIDDAVILQTPYAGLNRGSGKETGKISSLAVSAEDSVHTAGAGRRRFCDIQFADIESVLDAWVKGNLFLIKELARYRTGGAEEKTGSGIALVQYSEVNVSDFTPLEALILNGFESFIKTVSNADVRINGFLSANTVITEYADFIFKTLQEKSSRFNGRIFRFQTRQGLFIKKR